MVRRKETSVDGTVAALRAEGDRGMHSLEVVEVGRWDLDAQDGYYWSVSNLLERWERGKWLVTGPANDSFGREPSAMSMTRTESTSGSRFAAAGWT